MKRMPIASYIDDELLKRIKVIATQDRTTISKVVEQMLLMSLEEREKLMLIHNPTIRSTLKTLKTPIQ